MKIIKLTSRMHAVLLVIALSALAAPPVKAQCRALARNGGTSAPELRTLQKSAEPDEEAFSDRAGSFPADREKDESDVSVLGLWKNIYFSDGVANDIGFRQFNAGGTELLNDSGVPSGGNNFCMGVWKKVGVRRYELLHTFYVFEDPSKTPVGVSIEVSHITVSRDGNTFSGKWTQDNYDLSGKVISGFHFEGTVTGARISTELALFPFPFPF